MVPVYYPNQELKPLVYKAQAQETSGLLKSVQRVVVKLDDFCKDRDPSPYLICSVEKSPHDNPHYPGETYTLINGGTASNISTSTTTTS